MANPLPFAASAFGRHVTAAIALIAIALGGCSINLGSLTSDSDHDVAPKVAPTGDAAQTYTSRAQALMRSGKTDEALAEFDRALDLDPHNAEALYSRGLLYQGQGQHQLAVDDFTAANGLTPQRAEPLLGRAISYLALDKPKEAAADLDEAVQDDPQNSQIWVNRGIAYERLGDNAKAASSYSRAVTLRPRDDVARSGLARVGGKPG